MSNSGTRYPGMGPMLETVAYGTPAAPESIPSSLPDAAVLAFLQASQKKRLRVSVRREDSGEMKIEIMVDGEVVAEGISDGTTLTIEKEI